VCAQPDGPSGNPGPRARRLRSGVLVSRRRIAMRGGVLAERGGMRLECRRRVARRSGRRSVPARRNIARRVGTLLEPRAVAGRSAAKCGRGAMAFGRGAPCCTSACGVSRGRMTVWRSLMDPRTGFADVRHAEGLGSAVVSCLDRSAKSGSQRERQARASRGA